ncbi:uncharacterized protein PHA67_004995 [Liasis olivaceus]
MAAEAPAPRRSRCRVALWLALLFGALGAAGLLAGACLDTAVSDLLVYLGGVGVFFSLPWWVFWVVGNLEVPPDELRDDVGLGARRGRGAGADGGSLESWRARRLARLARVFSARSSLPSSAASVASHADRPHARFASASASASSTSGPERAGAAGGRTASLSPGTAAPQDLAGNRWCIPETVESQSKNYCQSSDGCQETA